MFLKAIACEIAFREICYAAARTPNLVDLEFLTQGHHDTPNVGRVEIQRRIDAVPPAKYDAILIGYGLCSNILAGLTTPHTQLVIPRAHDCIALFLGSKERYQTMFTSRPGTYYYTSGWLECRQRRGGTLADHSGPFLPAHSASAMQSTYDHWVKKYGTDQAQYLLEVMKGWTEHYSHGVLIDYDFTKPLALREQVQRICAERGWQFEEVEGDLRLLQRWIDGPWEAQDFLVVPPGHKVVPTYTDAIIGLEATGEGPSHR